MKNLFEDIRKDKSITKVVNPDLKKYKRVVLHTIDGNIGPKKMLKEGTNCPYHFVISHHGKIYYVNDISKKLNHCGLYSKNSLSIGISVRNKLKNGKVRFDSLTRLVALLYKFHIINNELKFHSSLPFKWLGKHDKKQPCPNFDSNLFSETFVEILQYEALDFLSKEERDSLIWKEFKEYIRDIIAIV